MNQYRINMTDDGAVVLIPSLFRLEDPDVLLNDCVVRFPYGTSRKRAVYAMLADDRFVSTIVSHDPIDLITVQSYFSIKDEIEMTSEIEQLTKYTYNDYFVDEFGFKLYSFSFLKHGPAQFADTRYDTVIYY